MFSGIFAFFARSRAQGLFFEVLCLLFEIFESTLRGFFGLASRMIAGSLRESFGFSQPRFAIRVVDFDPSNYSLWVSSVVLPFDSWIQIP
jgi:hypothetical protein